mgnify:CR=1 FL=1|jgi:hypothetical protein|tara:strand:- start:7044 stop:7304 length:261 start_codon:yes stop_codon:yes gene_type:complete
MADSKPKAPAKKTKKAAAKKPAPKVDSAEAVEIVITIGKAEPLKPAPGGHAWNLKGEEVTEGGDRYAVARLTLRDLGDLGFCRKKR